MVHLKGQSTLSEPGLKSLTLGLSAVEGLATNTSLLSVVAPTLLLLLHRHRGCVTAASVRRWRARHVNLALVLKSCSIWSSADVQLPPHTLLHTDLFLRGVCYLYNTFYFRNIKNIGGLAIAFGRYVRTYQYVGKLKTYTGTFNGVTGIP